MPTHGFRVYTVRRTEGDRLWVTSDSVEGWIPAKQVVLFDQAVKFYSDEIAGNPENSRAWRGGGGIWLEKKDYDKAIADSNEAIRLDPQNARPIVVVVSLVREKRVRQGDRRLQRGDPTRSQNAHGSIRGEAWYRKKSTTRPSRITPRPSGSIPKLASAYNDRGNAWQDKREYDKAIADYNEAIRLDPKKRIVPQPRQSRGRQEGLRQGHRRLQRSHPTRSQVRCRLHAGPCVGRTRRSTTRPSPTTPRPSDSTRRMPTLTTTGQRLDRQEGIRQGHRRLHRGHPARSKDATAYYNRGHRLDQRRNTTRPSPTTARPSGSIPNAPMPTTTGASPGTPRRSTTRRSPTTPRPSDSIPRRHGLPQPGQCLGRQEGVRQGHRRLQRGHPARSQGCRRLPQPGQSPGVPKKEYDKAIADYNEAIRLDPKDAVAYTTAGDSPGQK